MQPPKPRKSPESLFAAVDTPHFPAQALSFLNPVLRGKLFAVVEQNAESHKTPILALSKAAKEIGVMPGVPVFVARRRWPRLQILARDLTSEAKLRQAMATLLLTYTPIFTIRGNGSALLDMTGTPSSRTLPPKVWGENLQKHLLDLGFEAASLGIAASQTVARVLARLCRPDGMDVCPKGNEASLLGPLSPELLPGLSPHGRELLRRYGLASISTLRNLGKEEITLRFGNEGEKLYTLARGLDFESVSSKGESVSAETILSQDLNNQEALRNQVRLTADKLGHMLRLREYKAARITLVLTYSDKKSARKTLSLHPPTSAFLELAQKAILLFEELYRRRVALRRIGIQVSTPLTDTGQLNLFDTAAVRKREALETAIDKIRVKRSFQAVLCGSNVAKII